MRRRDFLAVVATAVTAIGAASWAVAEPGGDMYGQIGKITAISGKRDELIAILLDGVVKMPGCLSYIVAKDTSDADAIWISEAWDSKASHEASLSLPSVKDSVAKGRPLIAGFSYHIVTTPVGGTGLGLPKRHKTPMRPKDVVKAWVEAFNRADIEALASFYREDAINHQVAEKPIEGRDAIREMFARGFATAKMVCVVENIFEDGEWAILEWRDPKGLRGCGFFHVIEGKIVFQRGYWDKLSFLRLYGLPLPDTSN